MTDSTAAAAHTRKDFLSDVAPRWCPGCGCYSVFAVLTKVFASLDLPREKYALVSGIGCSSRLPYYANTYGFHTLHGRAPTVATGLKLSQPDLSVWMITGDGDGLSIGGNHFIHLMRRNMDVKVLLLNNQIYALTKGQTSPTTPTGKATKSTPFGSFETPINPTAMAISAGATFAARVPDTDVAMLTEVLTAAAAHRGTAFVEVLLNCVIFNDGAHSVLTGKETRDQTTIRMKPGQPLLYGGNRALVAQQFHIDAVELEENRERDDILIHDPTNPDPVPAYALALLEGPHRPVAFGVFRNVSLPILEDHILNGKKKESFEEVLAGTHAWTVAAGAELN